MEKREKERLSCVLWKGLPSGCGAVAIAVKETVAVIV